MDSDQDVNDFYSDGTDSKSDDGDETYVFDAADDFDDGIAIPFTRQEQSYKILTDADISRLQEDDVLKLSNLLFISTVESIILLCNYSWDSVKLQDDWFADEDRVRSAVGLLKSSEKPITRGRSRITCTICFDKFPRSETSAASCGHRFCDECWRRYVSISAGDGPSCLTLRCPEPSCSAAIGRDMVDRLANEEDKEKYRRFLLRSYVEGSRSMKWCPAPGCEFAVEFEAGSASYDVCCRCSYQFCWNCTEEAHRPVDCETVSKWIFKNKDEAENTNWILANSKPCPKCRRPIEKNHGCMHMTCRPPCNFQFCWICLSDWKKHDVRSGGSISCNGFEKVKKVGEEDEFERRRKMAKMSIERYTHYYERWAANHSSRQKALADLESMQREKLEKLRNSQNETESQVKFVTEAWEQIVECRRVLKWTYAYGFYLPEEENAKKQFFEYLQGEAEAGLERLHQCAERELQGFLDAKDPSQDFSNFRTKLVDLTCVTRTYFENLVGALEKGLEDVDCSYRDSKDCGPSQEDCGTSSRKSSKKGSKRRNRKALDVEMWSCNHCTFNNYGDTSRCAVCEQTR